MEAILFIAVVVLLIWVASVSNRVSVLEKALKGGGSIAQAASVTAHDLPSQPGFLEPKVAPVAMQEMVMPKPVADFPESKPMTEARERELTSSWLNKIGIIAVLLGMVFFFKYAIDQGWINPWMRIIIGFVVSGLLIYLGELWKEKYGSKAMALSGGGIALFYFSIFAGYQFYHIIQQPIAWILMLGVAALSVYLSFKHSSLTLGVLGFFGAYGSPLMLSSATDQQVTLFVFLSIMNIAAIIICLKKFWTELLFLGLLGTAIDFIYWAGNYSNQQNTFTSVFFVIFSVALLVSASVGLVRYHKKSSSLPEKSLESNLGILFIGSGLFYFLGIWILLQEHFHNFLAPISLLGAVIFFFAYAVVDIMEYRKVNYCLSFAASWLLVYAAVWQYDGKALAFALLLIALLGSSVGFLLKREELRVWALIVLFISLFKSLFEPYGVGDAVFLFNAKFGLMFANSLAMLFVGWLYSKFKASDFEKNVEESLQIVAALVLWVAVSWDIFSAFTSAGTTSVDNYMTFWWVVYPAVLAAAAYMGKRAGLMKVALLLVFAGLIKVLILPYADNAAFLFNTKFGLMFAEAVGIFLVGWLYAGSRNKPESADTLYVVASLQLWYAVSWEITQYFGTAASVNVKNLLLSLWWVVYAVALMIASGIMKKSAIRKLSLVLFALSILKVFLYDVQALDTPYRIVAFIVLGVILLSVSFTYNKNKEKIVNFLEGEKK